MKRSPKIVTVIYKMAFVIPSFNILMKPFTEIISVDVIKPSLIVKFLDNKFVKKSKKLSKEIDHSEGYLLQLYRVIFDYFL